MPFSSMQFGLPIKKHTAPFSTHTLSPRLPPESGMDSLEPVLGVVQMML